MSLVYLCMSFYLEVLYVRNVQPSFLACRPDREIFGWGPVAHGKALALWVSPLVLDAWSGVISLKDSVLGISEALFTISTTPFRLVFSYVCASVSYPLHLVKDVYDACNIVARNPITLALKPGFSAQAAEILAIPAWSVSAGVLGALFGGPVGCIIMATAMYLHADDGSYVVSYIGAFSNSDGTRILVSPDFAAHKLLRIPQHMIVLRLHAPLGCVTDRKLWDAEPELQTANILPFITTSAAL